MIELFLDILIGFGLTRKDLWHQKKIKKQENADGKSRFPEKYLLQPSSIIILITILILSTVGFLFIRLRHSYILPHQTKNEIIEIEARLGKWQNEYGIYPEKLTELIGTNPLRKSWETDSWNIPYKYTLNENGKGYKIISAGPDKKFGTEDDISSE